MRRTMATIATLLFLAAGGCESGQRTEAPTAKAPPSKKQADGASGPQPMDPGAFAEEKPKDRGGKQGAAASSDDAATGSSPGSADDTYTVQKGDTLWSIAEQVYGDGKRWREIAEANGIEDPTAGLKPGQVLVIP